MRFVLFLDFDGVLHPAPVRDPNGMWHLPKVLFAHMPRLVEVLERCSALDVVISSAWRRGHRLRQLRERFPESIRDRVVGRTPITASRNMPGGRQEEAAAWMRNRGRRYADWLAIDDDAWRWREGESRLVHTDYLDGLTPAVADQLVARVAELVQRHEG